MWEEGRGRGERTERREGMKERMCDVCITMGEDDPWIKTYTVWIFAMFGM